LLAAGHLDRRIEDLLLDRRVDLQLLLDAGEQLLAGAAIAIHLRQLAQQAAHGVVVPHEQLDRVYRHGPSSTGQRERPAAAGGHRSVSRTSTCRRKSLFRKPQRRRRSIGTASRTWTPVLSQSVSIW